MNSHARSEKVYLALLNLYPATHRTKFGREMFYAFVDMLEDNSPSFVWLTVLRELPVNILQEHISALRGGEVNLNKNIFAIGVGVVSIVGLFIISVSTIAQYMPVVYVAPAHSLFPEQNGPMSLAAWLAYFLSGIIVGIITERKHALIAMIAGGLTWVLWILFNI